MALNQSPSSASRQASSTAGRLFSAFRTGFIAYARWLDSLTWVRFFLLALLALIVTGILSDLPPFNLPWGEDRYVERPSRAERRAQQQAARHGAPVVVRKDRDGKSYEISIDDSGVHVRRVNPTASEPAASAPAGDASAVPPVPPSPGPGVSITPETGVTIRLPQNADTEEIKRAIEEAEEEIEDAISDASPDMRRIPAFRLGEHMPQFMVAFIFMSILIKIMAAGRFKAEAQAVQATEVAEAEALKRQVVEARMAAMQAQVEPHFLFNTLASIDHLIETDPPRASRMQKNLIALLRASMPTMREANAQGTRDLGREIAVIRPFLEILKVRMEERLQTEVRVPDGLLSADFPPMMLQSLVENAIKHGLEPKPEGGTLTIGAEIVHGKLAVKVADTGLGFGKAPTAGTGIGLDNIRERLKLLYGNKASLTVAENPGGGTAVTITVPYTTRNHKGDDE
ncbi:MAG TPA: histidine kinase [Albitalea sp.]|nr:histidine kinase [Albitalea sp.]